MQIKKSLKSIDDSNDATSTKDVTHDNIKKTVNDESHEKKKLKPKKSQAKIGNKLSPGIRITIVIAILISIIFIAWGIFLISNNNSAPLNSDGTQRSGLEEEFKNDSNAFDDTSTQDTTNETANTASISIEDDDEGLEESEVVDNSGNTFSDDALDDLQKDLDDLVENDDDFQEAQEVLNQDID